MSDYLTNLVSRSFGTAQVVRPRLPALFESSVPAAPALETLVQTEAPAMTRLPLPASPESDDAARIDREYPIPKAVGPESHASDNRLGVTEPPLCVPKSQVGNASLSQDLATSKRRSSNITEELFEKPQRQKTALAPKGEAQTSHASELPVKKAQVRTAATESVAATSVPLSTSQPHNPAKRPAITMPRTPERIEPAIIRPAMRVTTESLAAQEPPSINVSIGRVDVRAVFSQTAQPAVRARPSRPKAMSLDDYLKKRSEVYR